MVCTNLYMNQRTIKATFSTWFYHSRITSHRTFQFILLISQTITLLNSDADSFHSFQVQILFIQTKMKLLTYRSWKNVNLTEFGDTLESSLDLNVGLGICQNNSNLLTVFNQTVETITDFMAPIKKRNKLIRECDFFDSELIFMKRIRRKLERMYRKKKIVFDDFKEFDREMRNCFAAKKREFFRKKIEAIQTDSKKFRALDKLIGNKTEAVLPFHKCKVTLANNFNDYFAGKVSKLCTETLSMDMLENSFKATPVVFMESFSYIKLEDLHQAVLSMSNATAPHDLIRTVILKKLWSY